MSANVVLVDDVPDAAPRRFTVHCPNCGARSADYTDDVWARVIANRHHC